MYRYSRSNTVIVDGLVWIGTRKTGFVSIHTKGLGHIPAYWKREKALGVGCSSFGVNNLSPNPIMQMNHNYVKLFLTD